MHSQAASAIGCRPKQAIICWQKHCRCLTAIVSKAQPSESMPTKNACRGWWSLRVCTGSVFVGRFFCEFWIGLIWMALQTTEAPSGCAGGQKESLKDMAAECKQRIMLIPTCRCTKLAPRQGHDSAVVPSARLGRSSVLVSRWTSGANGTLDLCAFLGLSPAGRTTGRWRAFRTRCRRCRSVPCHRPWDCRGRRCRSPST